MKSAAKPDGTHWNKAEIVQTFGFPVLSKETASKIELLQHPSPDNITVRHAIITGETGVFGGNRTGTRMKLSQKWLKLFGGYENEHEHVNYGCPDFQVSSKCCYYLKEKPCDDWGKEHTSVPYLGLMASEGGRRQKSLMLNGCNYFGKTTIRSAPFAIFNRNDLLQLALDLDVPVPEIYGTIERRENGELYTTGAQRTGCSMEIAVIRTALQFLSVLYFSLWALSCIGIFLSAMMMDSYVSGCGIRCLIQGKRLMLVCLIPTLLFVPATAFLCNLYDTYEPFQLLWDFCWKGGAWCF